MQHSRLEDSNYRDRKKRCHYLVRICPLPEMPPGPSASSLCSDVEHIRLATSGAGPVNIDTLMDETVFINCAREISQSTSTSTYPNSNVTSQPVLSLTCSLTSLSPRHPLGPAGGDWRRIRTHTSRPRSIQCLSTNSQPIKITTCRTTVVSRRSLMRQRY